MKKFIFITSIPTNFWAEIAREENSHGIECKIIATTNQIDHRANYWKVEGKNEILNIESMVDIISYVKDYSPHVVVISGLKARKNMAMLRKNLPSTVRVGIFSEMPNKDNKLAFFVKLFLYRIKYSLRKPDFVLTPGERSVEIMKIIFGNKVLIFNFPYHQTIVSKSNNRNRTKISFLFSGQAIQRNCVSRIVQVSKELISEGYDFKLNISSYGTGYEGMKRTLLDDKNLCTKVQFFEEFQSWGDRLQPYCESDVLLLPALHSGWGLVVQEAIAHSMAIISTRDVEAARYYMDEGINGIFIENDKNDLKKAMKICIDNPKLVEMLKSGSEKSKWRGAPMSAINKLNLIFHRLF